MADVQKAGALETLLRRDRIVTAAGLFILILLAWAWLVAGAGLGHGAGEMTSLALFPHKAAGTMPGMGMDMAGMPGMESAVPAWDLRLWLLTLAMWWTMMIAMMAPSAAPTVLLFARVHRHSDATRRSPAPTAAFVAGYLAIWLAFSLAAAALQWTLQQSGLLSAHLGSQSRWLSAGVLAGAGLYQLSPLQGLCLSHCRSPAGFLSRHWRPGTIGAARLGVMHGAYCVGCCWLLMALLFVGGVMNLAWIAALTLLVLAEKVAPGGRWIGRGAGLVLLAWAAATLFW